VSDPRPLSDWMDAAAAADRLIAIGLDESAARPKGKLFASTADTLQNFPLSADTPVRAFYVPGRIEVLGKHTDYAGGRSLLATAQRGFCVLAARREDPVIRIAAAGGGGQVTFDVEANLTPTLGHWSNYPMTVARRIARNFPTGLVGADVAFASDLPVAAGMSSSSALVVACYLVLAAENNLEGRPQYYRDIHSPAELAGYLGTIENGQTFAGLDGDRGVGTFGGSEDHTAMLCCKAGRLAQYAYCPVRFERDAPMPDGHTFAIAASGVAAEKTGRAMEDYNRASHLARAVVDAWNEATGRDDPHIAAALASGTNATTQIGDVLRTARGDVPANKLVRRFEHFLTESEQIIPAATDALDKGDLAALGRLARRSQQAAEMLLGNQTPETSYLEGRS
jgi:galactokinase